MTCNSKELKRLLVAKNLQKNGLKQGETFRRVCRNQCKWSATGCKSLASVLLLLHCCHGSKKLFPRFSRESPMHFPHHHLSLSVNSVLKNYSLANNHVCNFAKPLFSLSLAKTDKEPLFVRSFSAAVPIVTWKRKWRSGGNGGMKKRRESFKWRILTQWYFRLKYVANYK